MQIRIAALAVLAAAAGCTARAGTGHHTAAALPALSVVPQPRELQRGAGTFVWRRNDEPHVVRDSNLARLRGREAYAVRVDADGIHIRAASAAAEFYATRTLMQLTRFHAGVRETAFVRVTDWPAYRWRGIHLDVSRHFCPVPAVEQVIDLAAHYKLNVFHWHLTDDQAWRLQIRTYPRLAAPASYSPQDVARVLAFARKRFVTVVPEIEVPGHNRAARAAYPAQAGTERFWKTIAAEVRAEFPGSYVHLGGDEVRYTPAIARRLNALARETIVQGRTPVVWDDAAAAAPPRATVYMVWRRYSGLEPALHSGHPVVLTPDGPYYFDAYQGSRTLEPPASPHLATLEEVYDYDPPTGASVLGVQANVWTEKIATQAHLTYMLFPRLLAFSESAWTPRERKSWPRFVAALPAQLQWLHAQHVVFRIPGVAVGIAGARFFSQPGNATAAVAKTRRRDVRVVLSVPLAGARIYFTTDGSVPSARSALYRAPLRFRVSGAPLRLRAVAILDDGRTGAPVECAIVSDSGLPARAGASSWESLVSP